MAVSSGDSHQLFSLLPQARGRQISTIDQWTSAFLVFGAIYAQRFPEAAPGLFKYCEVVRDIAATGPPLAWRQYDARFRSLRQFDLAGFLWEQPRWDLFFKCMYTSDVQGGQLVLPVLCPPNPVPAALSSWLLLTIPARGQVSLAYVQIQARVCQMSCTPPIQLMSSKSQQSQHQ